MKLISAGTGLGIGVLQTEKALQRLTNRGEIRRPYRGLYDKPGVSKLTGKMVFPPRASFVDAIARWDKLRILVDGMTATNDLGLSFVAFHRRHE